MALPASVHPRPSAFAGRVAAACRGIGRLDVLIAVAATALSQVSIWVLGAVPGPRGLMAVVLLFATVPLAWRRRAPLVVVALAMAAMTFQAVYTGQASEDPGGWAPFLVRCTASRPTRRCGRR